MKQTKLWIATAAVLLCGAVSVNGQGPQFPGLIHVEARYGSPIPIVLTKENGLLSTTSINEANGIPQYEYTSPIITLGGSAFFGCKNLTAVTISKGVKKIGNQAFCYCGMTSVTIPNTVKEIEFGAFRDCHELTTVTLPKRFKGREKDIFENCDKLKKIRYKGK